MASPSLRSIIALAPAAASARPSARRGRGRRWRAHQLGRLALAALEQRATGLRAAQLAGHADEIARAGAVAARPARPRSSAQPVTATVTTSAGPATTSPPAIVVSHSRGELLHRARRARARPRSPAAARATRTPRRVRAPIAARSESAVASAFQPTSAGECVARLKWAPSTTVSIEVTASGRARTTAASSPVQRTSGRRGRSSAAWIARDQLELGHAPRPLLAGGRCRRPAGGAALPAGGTWTSGAAAAPTRSSVRVEPCPPVPVPSVPSVWSGP